MFFSPMCRVTKSWCPSRLSARLMAHGINPCPAVKVSDLRTGITSPAVAFLLQKRGKYSLSDSLSPSLMDVLSGRTYEGLPLIYIFSACKNSNVFPPLQKCLKYHSKITMLLQNLKAKFPNLGSLLVQPLFAHCPNWSFTSWPQCPDLPSIHVFFFSHCCSCELWQPQKPDQWCIQLHEGACKQQVPVGDLIPVQ